MANKLQRVANDFYPSPQKLIESWLKSDLHVPLSGTFLEPCDGEGAISDALRLHGLSGEATDITDGAEYDATTDEYWEYRRPDWTITNPPFNLATPIITHAIANSQKGVIMILRASFLEPCKDRRNLLDLGISHVTYVNPRPKFRSDTKGSDSATVVFITWLKDKPEHQHINYLLDWNQ